MVILKLTYLSERNCSELGEGGRRGYGEGPNLTGEVCPRYALGGPGSFWDQSRFPPGLATQAAPGLSARVPRVGGMAWG